MQRDAVLNRLFYLCPFLQQLYPIYISYVLAFRFLDDNYIYIL